MKWYYAENNAQVGPLTDDEFKGLVDAGRITQNTLVWHAGMPNWAAYGTLPRETVPQASQTPENAPKPASGVCCECGKLFPADEMIRYESSTVCADCKPGFFQKLQEGATLPGFLVYGGFWIRFVAKFIDGIILGVVNMIFSFAAMFLLVGAISSDHTGLAVGSQVGLWMFQMLIGASYNVLFVGKYGATPGKMACKLRIIRSDATRVSYGRALGRHFAEILSGLTLMVGYLMAAFDLEKRTLHDRICDTRVIVKQD